MDPYPACDWWKQVLVAVGAEPPFELGRDRHQIFHGNLARKLDVPVRKYDLAFPCARLSKPEQIRDPLRRNHLLHLFILRPSP
jgi:hypothetical protein